MYVFLFTEEAINDLRDHHLAMKDPVLDKKWKENAVTMANHARTICLWMGCEGKPHLKPLRNIARLRRYVEMDPKKLTPITDS